MRIDRYCLTLPTFSNPIPTFPRVFLHTLGISILLQPSMLNTVILHDNHIVVIIDFYLITAWVM